MPNYPSNPSQFIKKYSNPFKRRFNFPRQQPQSFDDVKQNNTYLTDYVDDLETNFVYRRSYITSATTIATDGLGKPPHAQHIFGDTSSIKSINSLGQTGGLPIVHPEGGIYYDAGFVVDSTSSYPYNAIAGVIDVIEYPGIVMSSTAGQATFWLHPPCDLPNIGSNVSIILANLNVHNNIWGPTPTVQNSLFFLTSPIIGVVLPLHNLQVTVSWIVLNQTTGAVGIPGSGSNDDYLTPVTYRVYYIRGS